MHLYPSYILSVAEYVFTTFTGSTVDIFGVVITVALSVGGQQTIGVDPSNEHSWGMTLFLIPCLAISQFWIRRQMWLEELLSPFRQISPLKNYGIFIVYSLHNN